MISIQATLKLSLRSLCVNRMRSILTMLGIVIGVGAVIAMLAVGTGANRKIAQQVASVGSNLIVVLPGSMKQSGVHLGTGTKTTLNIGDATAIGNECPAVEAEAPVYRSSTQVIYGNQNWATDIIGTTPDRLEVRDCFLAEGRNISDRDVRNETNVCLLGQTVEKNLFGDDDPTGKIIRVKHVPFRVIGVMEEKGQSFSGQDLDDVVCIPITTAQKKLIGNVIPGMVNYIIVKAKTADDLPTAEAQVTDLLMQRHNISSSRGQDFQVRNITLMLQMAQKSKKVMTVLLGVVASISLLVGGIGIMNVMLMSVTERTREIGIRMAVGAKARDIRLQFVMEAITQSLIGGIVGVFVGVIASIIISQTAELPILITPFSILLSLGFSALIGIFFGFYPAYKASCLNPIDALRYE